MRAFLEVTDIRRTYYTHGSRFARRIEHGIYFSASFRTVPTTIPAEPCVCRTVYAATEREACHMLARNLLAGKD